MTLCLVLVTGVTGESMDGIFAGNLSGRCKLCSFLSNNDSDLCSDASLPCLHPVVLLSSVEGQTF